MKEHIGTANELINFLMFSLAFSLCYNLFSPAFLSPGLLYLRFTFFVFFSISPFIRFAAFVYFLIFFLQSLIKVAFVIGN